jgi:hypothetical protein
VRFGLMTISRMVPGCFRRVDHAGELRLLRVRAGGLAGDGHGGSRPSMRRPAGRSMRKSVKRGDAVRKSGVVHALPHDAGA